MADTSPARALSGAIVVPLRTVPGLNVREHWQARSSRVKKERKAVAWCLVGTPKPPIPCSVRLTRVSPGTVGMDDDNLPGSLKSVRDQIAEWLGIDDRDRNQVRYHYAQRHGPHLAWGVEIEFGVPAPGAQFELLGMREEQPQELPF